MILKSILGLKPLRICYQKMGKVWIKRKLETVIPFLNIEDSILDIGSGNGMLMHFLHQKNYDVQGIDVAYLSYYEKPKTWVYNGKKMPFENKAFDVGMLLTVLHHTDSPEEVLAEAMRVCKRLIIIEDVYDNIIQQYATYGMDTLVNLGHSNMTYQNKNDEEWKVAFREMGLELVAEKEKRVLLFFKQKTYVLETTPNPPKEGNSNSA